MYKKPYVIINCAISADGKIALPFKKRVRISSEKDMRRVHKLRASCDAILVGINTILSDDPKLTVKKKYVKNAKNPMRVILDTNGRIPLNARVLKMPGECLVVVGKNCTRKKINSIQRAGGRVLVCGIEKIDLKKLLEYLYFRNVKRLLVEGGGTVICSFLKEALADEINIYIGSMIIGGKNTPTLVEGVCVKKRKNMIRLNLASVKKFGDGILVKYRIAK